MRHAPTLPAREPASGSRAGGEGQAGGPARLGSDGSFECDSLQPGSWGVYVMFTSDEERPYVCADPPTVQVEAGKTAEAIVELGEGILVRGRFLDAKTGQAIPNSHVWATTGQVSSGFDGVPAKMDEDGSWFAIFPREGKYTLNYCIQRTTQQPVKHGEIDVRRDETMKEIAIRVEQQE